MKRADYITKMQAMIDDGITFGVYTSTTDNTLKDLKTYYTVTLRILQNMRKPVFTTIWYSKNAYVCILRHNYE